MKKNKGSMPPVRKSKRGRVPLSSIRVLLGIAVLTAAVYSLFLRSSKLFLEPWTKISPLSWAQENLAGPAAKSRRGGEGETGRLVQGLKNSLGDVPLSPSLPFPQSPKGKENGGATWDSLQEIQESLKKREARIQESEHMLEQEQQRLAGIRQEILQKIEELKLLRKELEEKGKQLDEQQEKRVKELSKIFEGAPPEKAGSIIAQTDIPTAAEIIMRMDKRKAGRLWGFVDPKLAAAITKNIMAKGAREEKPSARQSTGQ